MKCRICGCTDDNACWDEVVDQPCSWTEPDLCSVCFRKLEILDVVLPNPGDFAVVTSLASGYVTFLRAPTGEIETMRLESMEDVIRHLEEKKGRVLA